MLGPLTMVRGHRPCATATMTKEENNKRQTIEKRNHDLQFVTNITFSTPTPASKPAAGQEVPRFINELHTIWLLKSK